jgi:hypothetical protein
MARKVYDSKPYAYNISLFDRDTYEDLNKKRKQHYMRMIHESDRWRKIRHEDIITYFTFQIIRMKAQIKRPWYCYYAVTGPGAPGAKEFLCWKTGFRAKTIRPQEAEQYRTYYAKCIRESKKILIWLLRLPPTEYTQTLHHYLLRFIVITRPTQEQIDAFRKEREAKISWALR